MRRVPAWLIVSNTLMLGLIAAMLYAGLQSRDTIHRLELRVNELKEENRWQSEQIQQQKELMDIFYEEFRKHEYHPPFMVR